MQQRIETVVVGAGQAGLAASTLLVEAGREHVVLERGRVGERWRSERRPSLRLLTPNWMTRLPGHLYDGPHPHGYMRVTELADRFERHATRAGLPVETGVDVRAVRAAGGGGYEVATSTGTWLADHVVVATGWFADPVVPDLARGLDPSVHQVHAGAYRSPEALPDGGVLVVGASASGVQIAEELAAAGRDVTVAAGRHTRLPRRYRDRDILWWLDTIGVLDDRAAGAPRRAVEQPSMQLAGRPADLDLATLAAAGVRVAGRLVGADGHSMRFADDLPATTADADRRLGRLLDRIDACAPAGCAPADRPAPVRLPQAPEAADLRAEGITTVVWATGHRPSFPWLHVPVLDAGGAIVQQGGVTAAPGLYTVGMRWQTRRSSTFVDGARHDARAVVDHLLAGLRRAAA